MFSTTVRASDWRLNDGFLFTVSVPLLGPYTHDSCTLSKDGDRILLCHTSRFASDTYETRATIEMPRGAADVDDLELSNAKDDGLLIRGDRPKSFSVWFTNPVHLTVHHELHERWWTCVSAMCAAADLADTEVWELAWAEMREVGMAHALGLPQGRATVRGLLERTPLDAPSPNARRCWSRAGRRARRPTCCPTRTTGPFPASPKKRARCERMLATVLRDGGLSRQDVVNANIVTFVSILPEGGGQQQCYQVHESVAKMFPDLDEYDIMQPLAQGGNNRTIMAFSEEEA